MPVTTQLAYLYRTADANTTPCMSAQCSVLVGHRTGSSKHVCFCNHSVGIGCKLNAYSNKVAWSWNQSAPSARKLCLTCCSIAMYGMLDAISLVDAWLYHHRRPRPQRLQPTSQSKSLWGEAKTKSTRGVLTAASNQCVPITHAEHGVPVDCVQRSLLQHCTSPQGLAMTKLHHLCLKPRCDPTTRLLSVCFLSCFPL